jgi:hypothetical protein
MIAQTLERGAKDNTTAVVITVAPSDMDIWT